MNQNHSPPRGLQVLLRLRDQIARSRERELAAAVQSLQQAEAGLARAEAAHQAAAERLQAARQSPLPTRPTGSDLHRGVAWQERLVAELAVAEERRDADAEARRQCAAEQRTAQQALARAQADLEVVERAWQAWDEARRAAEERRAEEELADLTAARRGR